MVIFLYGPDTYRSRQYLAKMVAKFKADRDPWGYNVVIIDAEKAEPGRAIMQEVLTVPFLAERKLIIIENLLASRLSDVRSALSERIAAGTLPESNVVALWEGADTFKAKDAAAFFKVLEKQKYKEHFALLNAVELGRWARQEVSARGGRIKPPALSYLVANSGTDMWALAQTIDQLASYANGRDIEVADVQVFVEERADDNIFNLVDAVAGRDPRRVYRMIREQYRQGEDAQFVFAMLVRQFRILLELRDLFEREDNPSSESLAKRLGLHPFVVKKSLPLVKRYTMRDLRGIHDRLLRLDMAAKTGRGEMAGLLDIFVGEVAYGRGD
ncbi:MAG: polymerase III subunit delta protein [Candidatus Magasanikbacteria bacterium GW2011_GWA2_56_11]|uniref:DNA-directed DNA polymerase n=1 Tax=Candidatus Magasanikbacteria bacterium GW2011_GWA2_56_11 TaxID=1619044 RepID=A0A0G1YEL5_9BACT|nr:MAG: polymerase III subunit delta protein [Candidatus Magasanikbacteria bacterium GW2011_GWA2_56_11]